MTGDKHKNRFFISEDGGVSLPAESLFEKLVTIAIFKEPFYAYLSKAVLDAEGIACSISDEDTSGFSIFSRAKAGYRLRVTESKAEKAIHLLLQESTEE
ncbi:MAG: hypothetical protein C4520_17285 [Candidatus Abyssobacteria bacterium SURF_5]|uniref:DUF2007 domain-containing protein n=1 Tax=Abyssobacteria bacterium (strain SURF_5) TaxID=2093360 RepID=A0A3A4NCG0_ABYX5|nr:MAG: hypothetical protein C4520_17285 [Candidatus Abyssubacteria bacterium SURF_5]